jgi:hypothetical protein
MRRITVLVLVTSDRDAVTRPRKTIDTTGEVICARPIVKAPTSNRTERPFARALSGLERWLARSA